MPFAAETPRPATQVAPSTPPAGEAGAPASPRADVVLAIEALTKRYGSLVAVDGISFEVRRGETFGILGPNGAGKTTTLEMIEGLRKPDAGRITLLSLDAVRQRRAVQERIGVQLQSQALWPELTVEETLKTFRALFRRKVAVETLLERFSLGDKRRSLVRDLSGGHKQRLSVATALVNDPEVVFLDEPTTGLDPQARRSFWDLIHDMSRESKTVIVTTHYMEEAEALCERVAIMDRGRIMAMDSPRELVGGLDFDNPEECTFAGAVQGGGRNKKGGGGAPLRSPRDVAATLAGLMGLTDAGGERVQSLQVRTAT